MCAQPVCPVCHKPTTAAAVGELGVNIVLQKMVAPRAEALRLEKERLQAEKARRRREEKERARRARKTREAEKGRLQKAARLKQAEKEAEDKWLAALKRDAELLLWKH